MTHAFVLSARFEDENGRPRFQSSLGASVGASSDGSTTVAILGRVQRSTAAAQLANAYVDGRRDPLHCQAGDVGSVVLDCRKGTVTVVAAPIGMRQIYWAIKGDELSIASHPRDLACLAGRAPAIRPEAIFQYVYFHMVPGPESIFEAVSKLEGGHLLTWAGGAPKVTRYWLPRFEEALQLTEREASEELCEKLRSAVARSLGSADRPGAFLSGGLDSSTVAGMASEVRPGIPTISMGFDAQGYDEMEYAQLASRHFGTTPLEYYVTPDDVLSTLPMIAAAFPEPFGNSSAAAAYHCARIARENGVDLLLAGDGGDELFGGNERYAKQLVFEQYRRIPRPLRSDILEPMIGAAARVTHAFPIGKALSYIQQANVPLPDRLQTYNFLHRHDPVEVFTSEFLESVDTSVPLRMLRDEYAVSETGSAINRMLFLDWKFTLHDNDLVKVNAMCHLAGVDVAYPMLDQDVVDFSMRIPGDWKVHNGNLRWFYKRALQTFLPDAVINKTKHGFGLPFGVWTRTNQGLQKMSEDALRSLGTRKYFRAEFIEEALRMHREGLASYYGELVWVLMALEFWLRAHQD